MPTLKQISCNVEWSGSNLPLPEFQTVYADGYVETFVAVPSTSTPFSIHLRSHGYIAPGLAMFVYMDGEYQCNRNRSNLKDPSVARTWKQTEVDFHVRQKEELMPDGSFSGKQWKFESLKTGKAIMKTLETLKTKISAEPPHHNGTGKRLPPHDAQYAGTIEVVVLRCYASQPSPKVTPSTFAPKFVPSVQPHEPDSPSAAEADTSSASSSDDESTSSDGGPGLYDGPADHPTYSSQSLSLRGGASNDEPASDNGGPCMMPGMYDGPADHPAYSSRDLACGGDSANEDSTSSAGEPCMMPGMYDGPADHPAYPSQSLPFGGDMAFDQPSSYQDNSHAPRSSHRNDHNSQDWSTRIVADGKGRNYNNNRGQNPSSSSGRHGNHEAHQTSSESQNRERAQRYHNGDESNDRNSTSNRSRNSRAGSAAPRTSPSQVWVQPQGTPGQAAPAVVINVSHGSPQPANLSSPTNNRASVIDGTNVDAWHNSGQPDKFDEHPEGTNQSPEGSNASKASQRSNNSGVWPTQNFDDDQQNEDNIEQENAQWQNTYSGAEPNENQWATAWDPKQEHGNPGHQKETHTWNNSIVDSRPVGSSSMEVQNNSSGWNSNEHNNGSNHMAWNTNTNDQKSPHENTTAWTQQAHSTEGKGWSSQRDNSRLVKSFVGFVYSNERRLSTHPSLAGQDPNQPSSRPSHNSPISKDDWANNGPNSQYPGATHHEATQHVAPNSWADKAVELSVHGTGSPQPAGPNLTGPFLPIPIDSRPRPHWSTWNQLNHSNHFSKSVVPQVELTEPLQYVPSEVAQKNKMSHQVHVGQAAEYVHKKASPKYMDDFTRPYAVFVFKYRSKGNATDSKKSSITDRVLAILEQILNITLAEPEAHEKERLQDLSKEELIEQLLQAKVSQPVKPGPLPPLTESGI